MRDVSSRLCEHGLQPRLCLTLYHALDELLHGQDEGPVVLLGHLPTLAREQRRFVRSLCGRRAVICCCLVPERIDERILDELVEAIQEDVRLATSARRLADFVINTASELQSRIVSSSQAAATRNGPVRPGDLLTWEESSALLGGLRT